MTVRVNGPTNVEIVQLCELQPGDTFADPSFADPHGERLYVYLEQNGATVECFRLSPSLGKTLLNGHFVVRRVDINLDWSYR